MTATASKLGSAPLTLDWSGLPASKHSEGLAETWKQLTARFESGEIGFYSAPGAPEISQAQASLTLAQSVLDQGLTDALFLGIGGSALGPICLLDALQERVQNPFRCHFLENPDPTEWRATLTRLRPEKTLVVAVTKSGTTFETLAQFLLALEWLGRPRWKSQVVVITDPEKGDLRRLARAESLRSLEIAPSIGGRFSIFSPVGLFPAALQGLATDQFLRGATQVRDYCEKTPPERNALLRICSTLVEHAAQYPTHVCMPYASRLRLIGDWFVQLWGESLGKGGKGFTPIAALGATDQHSILQLLRDGPNDKVTGFITVNKVMDEIKIPALTKTLKVGAGGPYAALQILEGHTLQGLLEVEYRAISLVLTRNSRPHWSIRLDEIDERSLGALTFAMSVMTAFTGTMMGVNPFDQPGVEEGKVYIRQALLDGAPSSP